MFTIDFICLNIFNVILINTDINGANELLKLCNVDNNVSYSSNVMHIPCFFYKPIKLSDCLFIRNIRSLTLSLGVCVSSSDFQIIH